MPKDEVLRKKLTRLEQRDLDIEIAFIEGVIRRDPRYVEALQILGDDYTRRGRLIEGLKIDEQLAKLRPDEPLVHYNLACSYSLTSQFDAAVTANFHLLAPAQEHFLLACEWLAKPECALRGGDALHLAIAFGHGCKQFVSFDRPLGATAKKLGLPFLALKPK